MGRAAFVLMIQDLQIAGCVRPNASKKIIAEYYSYRDQ